MNISQIATTRKTTKAFEAGRRIPEATIAELRTVLRYAPSSVNSQPWHFIIAGSDAGKAALVATLEGGFAYNAVKVKNASHVVVLCAKTDLDTAHLDAVLAQEAADGRFPTEEAKAGQANSRGFYVKMHREKNDLPAWIDRQVYIALGNLLQAAATLGIDACPMEGIDPAAIDAALDLPAKGLRCVVLCALGYSSGDDFNAKLPKSRLPAEVVFSEI